MPIWIDVDTAIELFVNSDPLVASGDGFTIDEGIAYNETGMDLNWNFQTPAGVVTQTNVVPTTTGDYDWAHVGNGEYKIEMTASSGASANNNTEGFGWFTGKCNAVLPWRSPTYGFRKASMNDLMIEDGTAQDNMDNFFDGTGYAMGTIKPQTDLTQILAHTLTNTGTRMADAFEKMFDVASPVLVASTVMLTAQSIWDLASAITTDFGTLLERTYQMLNNKLSITDSTGAVDLRAIGDGSSLATWGITDNDTLTVKTEGSW